ncbi:MAG: hypothetical protein E5V53_20825 [Mesorhizobium sp.]|nr:MAG: hypothetical protein E5V53_20825 [Mesorhizobium sp.]
MRALIVLAALVLAGCNECEQKFPPGSIVTHKLLTGKYLVIRSSRIENWQGYCLVDVRSDSGRMETVSVEELSK